MDIRIKSFAKPRLILILGVFFVVNLIAFYLPGAPGNVPPSSSLPEGVRMPDMQGVFSPEDINHYLTEIGETGRDSYRLMHLTTDFAFPFVYGLLFTTAISWLILNQKKPIWPGLALAGFITAVFDLGENFLLLYITGTYPAYHLRITAAASLFSILKFTFFAGSFLIIAFLGIRRLTQRRRENPVHQSPSK
jgi:hypothetical protein